MKFSFSYFSAGGTVDARDKYRLVLEGARYADENSFHAVWVPERHFQEFGGLYPNPSVLGAAIAVATQRIRIRSGSVVMPLHHPLRVAEEWAVVDNLSGGRVDLSFASGWHPADFVLSAGRYEDRKQQMLDGIDTVRRLWSGEQVNFPGVENTQVSTRVFPKPVQPDLPVWITTSGTPRTWQSAGELGAGVLAALIGDSMAGLTRKIKLYRQAIADSGRDPMRGHVTVMMHTFLGEDTSTVKDLVRRPLQEYLRAYMRQKEDPNLKHRPVAGADLAGLSDDAKDELTAFAFERYFLGNALLGTVEKCIRIVDQLSECGVDEIACLVDFGVPPDAVVASWRHLNQLREHYRISA